MPADQRAAFERARSGSAAPAFRLTERDAGGTLVPAGRRDAYFPVTFAQPVTGNEAAIGFDLASDPVRRAALVEARDTGKLSVTSRITLAQETGNQYGFLAYVPLYADGQDPGTPPARRDALTGFVLGVYRLGDLIAATRGSDGRPPAPPPEMHEGMTAVELTVFDLSAPAEQRQLHPRQEDGETSPEAARSGLHIARTLSVGGRQWLVVAHPAGPLPTMPGVVTLGAALIAGLVIVGLVAAFFALGIKRARDAEAWAAALEANDRRLAMFRAVIDHAPDPVYIVDPETSRFIDFNAAACHSLGYSEEELRDKTVLDVEENIPDIDTWARHVEMLRSEPEKRIIFRGRSHRKDGTVFPVEVGVREVAIDGGRYIVAQVRDISERETAERERQSLETQLFQAQKTEALGTMTGGIAHEFNNLLLPIISLSEMVMKDLPDDGRNRRRLEKVLEAGQRARKLVSDLLRFTAGDPEGRDDADVSRVFEETVSFLHSLVPSSIDQRITVDRIVWPAKISRDELRTVLMNLIGNATDAMGGGPGVLELDLRAADPPDRLRETATALGPGPFACLTVRDTGCGMAAETAARAFDPFFTTKPVGQGTGLGLYVVYRLVTHRGGTVTVDSTLGQGTSVRVYIPLVVPEGAENRK